MLKLLNSKLKNLLKLLNSFTLEIFSFALEIGLNFLKGSDLSEKLVEKSMENTLLVRKRGSLWHGVELSTYKRMLFKLD